MRQAVELLVVGVLTLISIIILHQRQWSLQNLLIGEGIFPVAEMTFLKISAGFLTSLAILLICTLLIRKLSHPSVVMATLVQIVWIEFEWNFSMRAADAGELMVRFGEELGALLAGGLLIGFLSIRSRRLARSGTPR
jgi:hypothetical protein